MDCPTPRRELQAIVALLAGARAGRPLGPETAWQRVLGPVVRGMAELRGLPPPGGAVDVEPLNGAGAALALLLRRDDALAHVYQALNAPALEAAFRATAREW